MREAREPFPFYPLVVAAFPVVSVYAANLAYVPSAQLVRPLLVSVGAALLGTLLLGALLRSLARGAAAATVLVLALFGYAWAVNGPLQAANALLLQPQTAWAILTLALTALAAWRIRRTKALNALAVAIAVVAAVNLAGRLASAARVGARAAGPTAEARHATGDRPDVFYVILDGHGRHDSVRRAIGYDDSAFVDGLRKRGFYVADRSRSNFCQTELSLASSLNMDFVQTLLPNAKPEDDDRGPLGSLIDDNAVARRFRAQGYRFLAVTSGFPPVQFTHADLQLGTRWGGTMIESTLLQMTPLATASNIDSMFDARRQNLIGAFENLASLGTPTPSPRFVVVHILAPHPPFVFDAQGRAVPHHGSFGYWDGDDYLTYVGGPKEYATGYAGQAAWVDAQTLATLDRLLAAEGPLRPIVIVQGDHGSKLHLKQNSLEGTDLNECFPILNAYLVPDGLRKALRPDLTPVNTFRTILHGLFGDDLPILPDRSFYSTFPKPYAFTDVTARVSGKEEEGKGQ